MNVGDQNTQQNGQNTINHPIQAPKKPNVDFWIILKLLFIILFLATAVILVGNYNKLKKNLSYILNTVVLTNPTPTIVGQSSENTPSTQVNSLKLEKFLDKELLGENDNYSVFLINPKSGDNPERTGGLIVYDKKNNDVIIISGTFSIFGSTIVFDDKIGEYLLLSTGTSMSRGIIPLSLTRKTLAGNEFCATSDFLFYKDYVVFGNCDTFANRPWEAGQAASLIAQNLINGQEKIIVKSDLMHQYGPTKILGDTLYYSGTYVTKEDDWQYPDNQKTISKTYSLLSL